MISGLSVSIHQISSIEELARDWQLLDQHGGSFFTGWSWIGTWLELLPDTIRPKLLRLQNDAGQYGLAVVVQRDERRHGIVDARRIYINATGDPAFDCITIEHNGFAGRWLNGPAVWATLTDWLASGAADADELIIPGVACDIEQPQRGSVLSDVDEKPAYRVELGVLRDRGGAIGSILTTNARQQLNRSIRSAAALGPVRLEPAMSVEAALNFFDRLKQLHILSWTRRVRQHAFSYQFAERFHRRLIERCTPLGEVELLRLSAGSQELGYLYNFNYNGIVYSYQSGFDIQYMRYRPGYIAHALAIERAAAMGISQYDFMAGANRLKQCFATDSYMMRSYTLQKPQFRFKVERMALRLKKLLDRRRVAHGWRTAH